MKKEIYSGKYVQLIEDTIGENLYEKVFVRGASIIFPVDEEKKFLFIEEYRPHEPNPIRIKPVTGFLDDGDDWEACSDKELQEEIGKKADSLELFYHLPHVGTVNVDKFFVLARGLKDHRIPNPDGEDAVRRIIRYTIDELLEKTLSGEIPIFFDSVGIFLLYHKVKNGDILL